MAGAIDKTSGTTPIADGTTYDPGTLGTDAGVASIMLYRDTTSGGTSSDFQLNSVNYVQDVAILSQGLISFTMYLTGGAILEANIPASGTHDAQISGTATGEGGLVVTLSGMLQSGTIISDLQLETFQSATIDTFTFSASANDVVIGLYESNGGTDSLPNTIGSNPAWVEEATGAITGAPLSQGKIWSLEVSEDIVGGSFGGTDILTGTNSGSIGIIVIKGAADAGGSIIPLIMHHRRQMQC